MKAVLAWIAAAAVLAVGGAAAAAQPTAPPIVVTMPVPAPLFTYQEVMVPMRDGARLQTVIMTPTNAKGPLPILLRRSPYGVPDKAYAEVPRTLQQLYADGYIFVIQNIRGRFKSEGTFSLSETPRSHRARAPSRPATPTTRSTGW